MMTKENVERILKTNGVDVHSKDEEIRSVLLSARFNHEEVDTAIMVLRENTKTKQTKVDGLHKVFRTDQALNASEISQLLGVDVDLTHKVVAGAKAREITGVKQYILFFSSIFLALSAAIFYMYVLQIGVFHPSSTIAFKFLG